MKKIKLSNGVEMPQLGYGVYQVEPDECERCVSGFSQRGYQNNGATARKPWATHGRKAA